MSLVASFCPSPKDYVYLGGVAPTCTGNPSNVVVGSTSAVTYAFVGT